MKVAASSAAVNALNKESLFPSVPSWVTWVAFVSRLTELLRVHCLGAILMADF